MWLINSKRHINNLLIFPNESKQTWFAYWALFNEESILNQRRVPIFLSYHICVQINCTVKRLLECSVSKARERSYLQNVKLCGFIYHLKVLNNHCNFFWMKRHNVSVWECCCDYRKHIKSTAASGQISKRTIAFKDKNSRNWMWKQPTV